MLSATYYSYSFTLIHCNLITRKMGNMGCQIVEKSRMRIESIALGPYIFFYHVHSDSGNVFYRNVVTSRLENQVVTKNGDS